MGSIEIDYNACLHAMLLSSGQVYSAVLNAAIELNLFEIIDQAGSNGISPSQIASKLSIQHADTANRLDRMLFLLASYSLLTSSKSVNGDGRVERIYQLSPTGKYTLNDNEGSSYATLARICFHPAYLSLWQNFKEVILDGEEGLFKKVHGLPLFEYMETDPTLKPLFHNTMADLFTMHMRQILEKYEGFDGISTLVDVGGGIGQSLKMITSKYPLIKGINFDLPHVAEHAPPHPGIKHIGGDMFKSVLEGDAIMIKATTHNWSDEDCIKLLKNCHKSLKDGGMVIVMGLIMPELPDATDGDSMLLFLTTSCFCNLEARKELCKSLNIYAKVLGFPDMKLLVVCSLELWELLNFINEFIIKLSMQAY